MHCIHGYIHESAFQTIREANKQTPFILPKEITTLKTNISYQYPLKIDVGRWNAPLKWSLFPRTFVNFQGGNLAGINLRALVQRWWSYKRMHSGRKPSTKNRTLLPLSFQGMWDLHLGKEDAKKQVFIDALKQYRQYRLSTIINVVLFRKLPV